MRLRVGVLSMSSIKARLSRTDDRAHGVGQSKSERARVLYTVGGRKFLFRQRDTLIEEEQTAIMRRGSMPAS